ncbi:protein shisa-5-like isoform X2 [Ornithodoros turicata]|uniref:protein shisa-5-like isoform X2 n=1 Tax=Ornithodoros turicata TaxID=34597 RepID=UPI003139789D
MPKERNTRSPWNAANAQDRHKRAMELKSHTLSALSLLYLVSVALADLTRHKEDFKTLLSDKEDFVYTKEERQDIQRTAVLGVGAVVGIAIASIAAAVLICVGCCCLCARVCRNQKTVTNTVVMQPQGQPNAAAYPVSAYPQQVQPNPSTGMPPPAYGSKQ